MLSTNSKKNGWFFLPIIIAHSTSLISLYIPLEKAYFKFINPSLNQEENWLFGISPEGIGFLGMILNFFTAIVVSRFYLPPPTEVKQMVETIRQP